ncbi:MAG: lipocalin-like domain-containing protein [FCB group bacterium]|nr:lipocalin-like domain-containing protein [FCB group bacterium]MBL7028543.1 lipocalin-like domain-containing protein [Candidatus Neomarinimicrobiota bacterium]MBL7120762.1 lipocalin-like domain-containing protein [Candidatus Neomarinimicrobiota bacterium]
MGNTIVGVWKLLTVVYLSGGDITTIDPALPGLFIFTDEHYSMTWMPLRDQQEAYADQWHPNDAEKIQSYNSIVTNTGRYELSGSKLTTHVEVAKTPAFVGGTAVYQCDIQGEEMRLQILDNVAHDGTRDEGYLKFKTILTLQKVE